MIKDQKKFIEHYEKLYEELKKKYENKEKENEQLKTLLKLRDKEIISLKTKIKSLNNNSDSKKENSPNNNNHEISKAYLENLIKNEMENIKKDLLLYRNKILTLENYELQYLAPKLTTGSNNNNYQYSSKRFLNIVQF
jgi:glycerol-3-phosphate dehydrogenase